MKNLNIFFLIFFIFLVHYFEGFENIYKISKRNYESRMQRTHGYCDRESYGFYRDMVRKYEINKYIIIQENFKGYPLLRGFFYEKDLLTDKKFVLILNYPDSNLPESLKVEGVNISLDELSLLEQKNNCYLYLFNS